MLISYMSILRICKICLFMFCDFHSRSTCLVLAIVCILSVTILLRLTSLQSDLRGSSLLYYHNRIYNDMVMLLATWLLWVHCHVGDGILENYLSHRSPVTKLSLWSPYWASNYWCCIWNLLFPWDNNSLGLYFYNDRFHNSSLCWLLIISNSLSAAVTFTLWRNRESAWVSDDVTDIPSGCRRICVNWRKIG
jgi:hypothetical protein